MKYQKFVKYVFLSSLLLTLGIFIFHSEILVFQQKKVDDLDRKVKGMEDVFRRSKVSGLAGETLLLWYPQLLEKNVGQGELEINAKAALALDYDTGEVFYAKNPSLPLPFASLAKVMTAMVVLNHALAKDELVVPAEADLNNLPEGSSYMGLTAGEQYSVEDLLYGLLLPSGNDAARTLAIGLAGDLETFVYWMNREAKVLGLKNTKFDNPSGLDNPQSHSTVYDLAILTHFALTKYPLIARIVATRQYEIPYTDQHKYLFFGNFNDLMIVYPNVDGVKPGNTESAGSCLIATSTREGKRMMTIVLGASARNPETIKLLDFAFGKLGIEPAGN